jgi:DNA-binding NarL/FixJ family response regulator
VIRVLLADDNDTLREALAEALEDHPGIEVVGHARNGRSTCEAAAALRPDVVVMDIRMPVMPGPEATVQVLAASPTTRVVGLTAHDDDALHEAMLHAGAVAVLVKGASIDQIVSAVEHAAASGSG